MGTATGLFIAFLFKDANGHDRIAFLWPTVFGFVITFAVGWLISFVIGQPVSEKAKQLTWWHVMRRPLPDEDIAFDNAAAEVRQAKAAKIAAESH